MSRAALSESESGRRAGAYHKFDLAGLGPAPYGFLGMTEEVCGTDSRGVSNGAPGQPAGCCDFCGQGIKYVYRFRAANGRVFGVGSDCALAAGDSGMRRVIKDELAKKRREKNEKRRESEYQRDMLRIYTAWSRVDEVSADLALLPHPSGFTDRETGRPLTLLNWCEWMMANGGVSGRLRAAMRIEAALEGAAR